MSSYAYRFVGLESLPGRLSDFDIEQFFQLSASDIEALTQRFRADRRVAGALQLLVLRASGRPLDRFAVLPRGLLRGACQALGAPVITIASLRTLYQRRPTLYEHQQWARNYLGIRELTEDIEAELRSMLSVQARDASHMEDLVSAACRWLYDRRTLIPGERRVQDWARAAFASIEADVIAAITAAVPPPHARDVQEIVYSRRPEGDQTFLEWLKTPPRRHSPNTLAETVDKVTFLKSLGVHQWNLEAITLSKQQAYARQIQDRRPAKSREIKPSQQLVEIVCFLRVSLLELTDLTLLQTTRRSQQLFREAAERTKARRAARASGLLQQAVKARTVLLDDSKSWQERVVQARELLADLGNTDANSFVSQVRATLAEDGTRVRACLNAIKELDIRGLPCDPGFRQIAAWRELQTSGAAELPENAVPDVGPAWHPLVHGVDHRAGLRAFAACTMMSLRRSLRRGSVWVNYSSSFRARDQILIPPELWETDRSAHISALGMPENAHEFLEPLLANLTASLLAVAEAHRRGKVEVDAKGMLRLPALAALPHTAEPMRTREALYQRIGRVQFPDMLVEIDTATGFSEALLGRRPRSSDELIAVYGALIAHGTEVDAKAVAAMVPGLEAAQVSVAMRALEASGRIRRANDRVAEFQSRIPIAALWGDGTKASADMMALDATRHLWNSRVDPRRRTFAAGIYTHVRDRWGVVYDQPIVLNERQAGAAIEGVEQHNRTEDRIRLGLLAVDTHGYTNPGLAVAKLLGFDICPRLRDLAERKLYLPRAFKAPEELEAVVVKRVSLSAIERGWDDLLRLAASIRSGRVSATLALQRIGSAAHGDPLHRAAEHLGRLLRTLFLCDYVAIDDFRREIHTLLNRGESVHQLQRVIYGGKVAAERGRRREEMKAISGAHALLTNIVIAWNTSRMHEAAEHLRRQKIAVEDDWLRRIGPAHSGHINFRGGENISQTAQFATSGSTQGGIIALSLALAPSVAQHGQFALIPAEWHQPLRQRMVLMKDAPLALRAFYDYVGTPPAQQIMKRYGFEKPRD